MRIKSTLFLFALMLVAKFSFAQYEVVPIQITGDDDNRVNYVFLGDGYLSSQQDKFITDVQGVMAHTMQQSPFKEYAEWLNVYAIKVPSNAQGAAMSPNSLIDNAFGASYWAYGIERLLVCYRENNIQSVLSSQFPHYDQCFIIVNHTKYGGAGGHYATASVHPDAKEIAMHEIGHAYAKLIDEYWAGQVYAKEGVNMTQQSSNPRWRAWNGYNNGAGVVGAYPHSESPSWHRPHQACKMRYLGTQYPFCPVCAEAFVKENHYRVTPVDAYTPNTGSVAASGDQKFTLDVLYTNPNSVEITWKLNGQTISSDVDEVTLGANDFNTGSNELVAIVVDNTDFIRDDNHKSQYTQTITWNVDYSPTGMDVDVTSNQFNVTTFPNPANDFVTLQYDVEEAEDVTVKMYDTQGRLVKDFGTFGSQVGEFTRTLDVNDMNNGSYIMQITIGQYNMTQAFVKN